ncbi:MAG: hypothetical protein AB8B53_03955 [Flavobacteriales bacterium]
MKLTYYFIFLTIACSSCASKQDLKLPFIFQELTYGVLESKKAVSNYDEENKSPSGGTVMQKELSVISQTDAFKGEKELIFGVQFIVNCQNNLSIPVTRVWTFPSKIILPNGKSITELKRTDIVYTNRPMWMYYTIEDESEIVPGR